MIYPVKPVGLWAFSLINERFQLKTMRASFHRISRATNKLRIISFPVLFSYVYIESPNPTNPEGPTPQAPNPINWKHLPQKPNLRPKPAKIRKIIKNNPGKGKKYSTNFNLLISLGWYIFKFILKIILVPPVFSQFHDLDFMEHYKHIWPHSHR